MGNRTDHGGDPDENLQTSYHGWTLQYDAAGNLVSRSKFGVPSQTFTWNGLGQLLSVSTAGSGTVSFDYDGFGRRVRKTEPNGAVTQYLYRGDDLLLEMDGSGNLRREYTYYPGIDRPHSVREHTSGVAGRYYFTMELPGHVSGLLNASGQMVNEYRYSPFGKPVLVQEGVPNPLRYMAREWDAHAGLYYVRNRWYDPEVGRFVSEDPIGLAGGINVYSYAWNDPVNHLDPLGLTPCPRSWLGLTMYIAGLCTEWPMNVRLQMVTVVAPPIDDPTLPEIAWRMTGDIMAGLRGGVGSAHQSEIAKGCIANSTEAVVDAALTLTGFKLLGVLGHSARAAARGRAAGNLWEAGHDALRWGGSSTEA